MTTRPILALAYNAAENVTTIDRRNRGLRAYRPTPASASRLARAALLQVYAGGTMKLVPTTYGWYLAS